MCFHRIDREPLQVCERAVRRASRGESSGAASHAWVWNASGGTGDQGRPVEEFHGDRSGPAHHDTLGDHEGVCGCGAAPALAGIRRRPLLPRRRILDHAAPGKGFRARHVPGPVGATSCAVIQSCSRHSRCSASKSYESVSRTSTSRATATGCVLPPKPIAGARSGCRFRCASQRLEQRGQGVRQEGNSGVPQPVSSAPYQQSTERSPSGQVEHCGLPARRARRSAG